jgi:hypothetical protein
MQQSHKPKQRRASCSSCLQAKEDAQPPLTWIGRRLLCDCSACCSSVLQGVSCFCAQVRAAYALAAGPTQVAAACAQGVVRLFSCKTLAFRATLPRFVARSQGSVTGTGGQCHTWELTTGHPHLPVPHLLHMHAPSLAAQSTDNLPTA